MAFSHIRAVQVSGVHVNQSTNMERISKDSDKNSSRISILVAKTERRKPNREALTNAHELFEPSHTSYRWWLSDTQQCVYFHI